MRLHYAIASLYYRTHRCGLSRNFALAGFGRPKKFADRRRFRSWQVKPIPAALLKLSAASRWGARQCRSRQSISP